jgi:hypothetical protein
MSRKLLTAPALLLAACLAWPPGVVRAVSPPGAGNLRFSCPLGTIELNPELRERLEALQRTLAETARELRALLEEKAKLTPEQEARLRELMERLRKQLKQLEEPEGPGLEHVLREAPGSRRV